MPGIVQPGKAVLPGNGFLKAQKPAGQCSVPLVNAPRIRVKERSMPTLYPWEIDPKMKVPPPALPCENSFAK